MAFDFSKFKGKKVDKGSVKEEALKNVLGGISKDASKKIAGNLKKVTVASNDKEGLKAGLDKAKEIVSKDPLEGVNDTASAGVESIDDVDGDSMEAGSEDKLQDIEQEIETLSPEQMKELVKKLQEKLAVV